MIYTDGVHLVSDKSLAELHEFARVLKLKPEWFQNAADQVHHNPHYDLTTARAKRRALVAGAVLTTPREILRALDRLRVNSRHSAEVVR